MLPRRGGCVTESKGPDNDRFPTVTRGAWLVSEGESTLSEATEP
jgi:hypothetical protein